MCREIAIIYGAKQRIDSSRTSINGFGGGGIGGGRRAAQRMLAAISELGRCPAIYLRFQWEPASDLLSCQVTNS